MTYGRRRLALLPGLLLAASACGVALQHGDSGGPVIVPGDYRLAAASGGHLAHVGAPAPDGGSIRCGECHAIGTDGFKAPDLRICAECHAARAEFHHGADAGLSDGGQVSCLTCHPFLAREGQLFLESPWECLDCHARPQGTKQAIEVHGAGCSYCHEPHREPLTQPVDCVVCHAAGLLHGAKGDTIAQTCMKCHDQHRPAAEATRVCLGCHSDEKVQKRPAARVTSAALFRGHGSCGACHIAHRFSKKEVKPCTQCHDKVQVLALGKTPKTHVRCAECHAPHAASQPGKTCQACHDKVKSSHPEKKDLTACTSCHPMHGDLPPKVVAKTCESCHDKPDYLGVVHGKDDKGQPLTCAKCHPTHAFAAKKGGGALCKECHAQEVQLAAKARKDGHAKCGDCHAGLPHKPVAPPKACLACHTPLAADKSGHQKCGECHEFHSGKVSKSCAGCHEVKKLAGLHAEPKHQACKDCHAPHDPQPGPQRKLCFGSCHQQSLKHEPKAERCTGCHLFQAASGGPPPETRKP